MRLRVALAAGAVSLAAPWASAQSTDEIVVTAPLEGSRIESLQGAAVLTREDVLETLNGGLGETLDAQPGVSSTFYGAGASRPIIRGLGDDRVRILQNGVGAIDAAAASPDHAVTSDGLDADRIEILRGAAALAYGGNAVGGVVNVIDQSIPTRAPRHVFGVETFGALTSVNDGREGALAATASVGPFVARLDASARETDDFAIPGAANVDGTGERGRAPNSYTSARAYTGGGALVGDWGFAGAAVKRTEDEYGLPPEAPGEAGGHIELEQTRIETRGDIAVRFGPFQRIDWGAQHSDYAHTEFEADGAAGTTFSNEGYEARVEAHNKSSDGRLSGAIGAQTSDVDFRADGDEKFIDPTETRDVGVFVVQRWDGGIGGFEGGLRYETREHQNAVAGARDFDAVSFSAGAFVRPAENWFAGVTLGRTERAPTAVELFANGPHLATSAYEIGDPSLGLETASSMEASLRFTTDAIIFEANLYRIAFDNYVALVPTGAVFFDDEGNGGPSGFAPDEASVPGGLSSDALVLPVFQFTGADARFDGGEASIDARLARFGAWELRGDAAVDWVEAAFRIGGALPRIPPRSVTLGLTGVSDALTVRVEGVDVAEQDDVAAFETTTAGSTVLNARAIWRPFAERRVSFILDGRNLTDEESRVHASFLKDVLPRPGRSVRLAVSASF